MVKESKISKLQRGIEWKLLVKDNDDKLKITVVIKNSRYVDSLRCDASGDFHFKLSMNWSFPNIITCDSGKIILLQKKTMKS